MYYLRVPEIQPGTLAWKAGLLHPCPPQLDAVAKGLQHRWPHEALREPAACLPLSPGNCLRNPHWAVPRPGLPTL